MSFVRAGRPQQHSKGKRPVRPKKAAAARGEWVSTVNDLSVHKLTPAELRHRHEIHKSHNQAAAQWELKERALQRRLRHGASPVPLDKASLSIIREVFSDQLLLQDVLNRSDRALAVVKDLFGDAPRRQTGHPSVTVAPNCDSDTELPVLQRPDPPTQLSLLSQSMMDQEALNEHSEEDYKDVNPPGPGDHVVRRVNVRKMKTHPQEVRPRNHRGDGGDVPVTPCSSGRVAGDTALNATVAVQRVRTNQIQSEDGKDETSPLVSQVLNPELPPSQSETSRNHRTRKSVSQSFNLDGSSAASVSGDQSSLGLLQAMLAQVEADLDSVSPDTSAQSPNHHGTQSLTGFSVALVSTLGRLVHLLKQREGESQKEAEERRRLEEEVKEQRGLIDALTAETMTLRDEAAALRAELLQQTAELEQKLDSVVLVMGGLGLLGEHIRMSQGSDVDAAVCQSEPEQAQVLAPPAVLLSPPRQVNKWQQSPATHPVQLHQQIPSVDLLHSCEDVQARGSASSLHSLQLSRLPSSSSSSSSFPPSASPSLSSEPLRLSPQALLAEIAQLSRQNELIKAQLSQAQGSGSRGGGSLGRSSERRGSSPGSGGRVSPQSAGGERRTSASSDTGRRGHGPEREPPTRQTTTPDFSVDSVEQRLQELNRQSAAARGRLLELIEQQRQSASVRLSPSVSPMPPSAFSPNTSGGGGSVEASVLQPERDLQADRIGTRSGGSDVSSRSSEGQTTKKEPQTNSQRQREGWFALSSHVR